MALHNEYVPSKVGFCAIPELSRSNWEFFKLAELRKSPAQFRNDAVCEVGMLLIVGIYIIPLVLLHIQPLSEGEKMLSFSSWIYF